MSETTILIEIPAELKGIADAFQDLITSVERSMEGAAGGAAIDYGKIEREYAERSDRIEREAHGATLASVDVSSPEVVIRGKR